MSTILILLFILLILFIMAFPFLPLPFKLRKLSTFYRLRYKHPEHRKNARFIVLPVLIFMVVAALFGALETVSYWLSKISIFDGIASYLLGSYQSQVNFIFFVIMAILVNIVTIYSFVILKALVKQELFSKLKKAIKGKMKKKDGEEDPASDEQKKDQPQDPNKDDRVPYFEHSDDSDDPEKPEEQTPGTPADAEEDDKKKKEEEDDESVSFYQTVRRFVLGLFFEGDEFEYARSWVVRTRKVLQGFIYLVEVFYLILFFVMLLSVFFSMPKVIYTFLISTLQVEKWYVYPFFSIMFLQEICNFVDAPPCPPIVRESEAKNEKKEETKKKIANIRALRAELAKRFDGEHTLRYYPESKPKEKTEYVCTNIAYHSALNFIKKQMEITSGHVVQSHMECLDAMYNNDHVYFSASYYSEFGEYVSAYTYIRLLSGARMIYIVSNPEEKATLRKHIGERLMQLTGSSPENTWRVYTADERLDQADILIATPSDFADDNLVEQYPGFFEEVCNAIFIDVDKMIYSESYLCVVMASRLQKATSGRIRFLFLSLDLLKGIAASTLPKYFCVDKVLNFSSADENESVSYTLWNKESKKHRIYNKNGQKLTTLECIIAELAYEYGIDGIRLMTEAPLGHAERTILSMHGVEINNLYRPISDINYMIYSDERCNLSAALYACTRFRGKERSVVHILSKPYLLREYFMSKALSEQYINRSSFIQPRVTEHGERHKLYLLRIFCEATSEKGMSISQFETRMRAAISNAIVRKDRIDSEFCRNVIANYPLEKLDYKILAAYLLAGLYDLEDCEEQNSIAQKSKDYYLVFDPNQHSGFDVISEKHIQFNRVKDIFQRLFACNRKVELCIHDEILGTIDTFPDRTHLEYIEGQSIIYNNAEYEIEEIAEDGTKIYLRRENVKFKNCLDTIHLRRYHVNKLEPFGATGVLHSTKTPLVEIRVTRLAADFIAETYGFYSLTTDRQTLNFYQGVEGDPHIQHKNLRTYSDGRMLKVELACENDCTDGMRMLLSAVFNEFIKTIFPKSYRCVAILPILAEALPYSDENEPQSEIDQIKALYPYLQAPEGDLLETDAKRMQFLFINDCQEDSGVLDWFYDKASFYMQEFIANVYAYLHWLQKHPEKKHYIYFGGEALPECYDLDGLCNLFDKFNWVLSDGGEHDYETAGDEELIEESQVCAFCHKKMESGRYEYFSKNRYICAECFNTVSNRKLLQELHEKVRKYLADQYGEVTFGASKVDFDPVYELELGQVLSQYYYRLEEQSRTIFVERDDPETNVEVSILRGLVELWQIDNNLSISFGAAQLYYEELCYLRKMGKDESADWIYAALDESLRAGIDEITQYVTGEQPAPAYEETDVAETSPDDEKNDCEAVTPNADDQEETVPPAMSDTDKRTSFTFMYMKAKDIDEEQTDDPLLDEEEGEEAADKLYKPNDVPRFWKRYLKKQNIDDGQEEGVQDVAEPSETEDELPFGEDVVSEQDESAEAKKPAKKRWFSKEPEGNRLVPHEEEEDSNPAIRVYNDMVRAAYNYSSEPISRVGVNDELLERIFYYVNGDYPEIFWINGYSYNPTTFTLTFRCTDAYGKLDVKQVNQKRAALRKGAKYFTRGISKRTDPYQALLTIYRRLILTLDYDGKGLDMGAGRDIEKDDSLRSLYSALVEHKVVCAGYAVALQYLLQSVGLVCGYVISEMDPTSGTGHAFNMVKIGKFVYYIDATWGDISNTKTGAQNKNLVLYSYCCVPYKEFIQTNPKSRQFHIPNKTYYPELREMNFTNHEYFRYNKAYFTRYNTEEIIHVFVDTALKYDRDDMGDFVIGFRCVNATQMDYIISKLMHQNEIFNLLKSAAAIVRKQNRKAAKLLDVKSYEFISDTNTSTVHIILERKK